MKENYAGVDYGRGMSYVDHETGIRYGVINQSYVGQAWLEEGEPVYLYCCGECSHEIGGEATDKCPNCGYEFEDWYFDNMEPLGWSYRDENVTAECGDDGDIFITTSKYFTYAAYCSPCYPGAGYLMNPFVNYWENSGTRQSGIMTPENYPNDYKNKAEAAGYPKVYCFGHDWFKSEWTGDWVDCKYCHGTGYRDVKDIPNFNSLRFVANGGEMHGEEKVVCWVCQHNHKHGQMGKVKHMIRKAPYPVFDVETGELVLPTEE